MMTVYVGSGASEDADIMIMMLAMQRVRDQMLEV